MNVSLTPELESLVEQKVKSGLYQSASEVIRAALRLLQQEDSQHQAKLEALRREIAIGFKDIDEGRVAEWDMKKIIAEAHARHSRRK